jgi:hypothetical protein
VRGDGGSLFKRGDGMGVAIFFLQIILILGFFLIWIYFQVNKS